jgi:hypothetical protein
LREAALIPQIPVCSHCRSESIKADACAVWDPETQQWELSETFDKGACCQECDGETRIDWRER